MISSFLAGVIISSPPVVEDTPSAPPAAVEECCFIPGAVKVASVSAPFD